MMNVSHPWLVFVFLIGFTWVLPISNTPIPKVNKTDECVPGPGSEDFDKCFLKFIDRMGLDPNDKKGVKDITPSFCCYLEESFKCALGENYDKCPSIGKTLAKIPQDSPFLAGAFPPSMKICENYHYRSPTCFMLYHFTALLMSGIILLTLIAIGLIFYFSPSLKTSLLHRVIFTK